MKHQQVVVDYWNMLKTSCTCLLLAISGYVLIKMMQTIFYLPSHLKRNQKRLEELAAKYELDLEREISKGEKNDDEDVLKQNEKAEKSAIDETNNTKDNEPKKVK